jgi:biopolymer transport protein ExbD
MLIFFVVTASFLKETGVDVGRPTATSSVRKEHDNILIGITANDEIRIDKRQVDLYAVGANVKRLQAEHPEGAVVVQADVEYH